MKFKKKFPKTESVNQYIVSQWGNTTQEVQAAVAEFQAEFIEVRRRQKIGLRFILVSSLPFVVMAMLMQLNLYDLTGSAANILVIIALSIATIVGLGYGITLVQDKNQVVRKYNDTVNAVIFSKLLSLLNLTGTHYIKTLSEQAVAEQKKSVWLRAAGANKVDLNSSPEQQQILALLDHSELITENRNHVVLDDMMQIQFAGSTLFLSELDVQHVTGSGKNKSEKKIFRGYFVSFDLPKTLSSKTFISTESDKKGFAHRSFWKNMQGSGAVETKLEWNDFENLLHVATTNETEARYVLTPSFMSDLYDWWLDKKQNIRISFIANRMYVLFPSRHILLRISAEHLNTPTLQLYMATIAHPLLHVLHLIEDVEGVSHAE